MDILVYRLNRGRLKVVTCWWCIGGETGINIFIIVAIPGGHRLLDNRRRPSFSEFSFWLTSYQR
jgi:hypothetical protein